MVDALSQLRVRTKVRLLLAYERSAESVRLDRLAGRFTPDPTPVNEEYEPASISGTIPDISFLVATTDAGLLLFEGPHARRLFRGRDFFGISLEGRALVRLPGFRSRPRLHLLVPARGGPCGRCPGRGRRPDAGCPPDRLHRRQLVDRRYLPGQGRGRAGRRPRRRLAPIAPRCTTRSVARRIGREQSNHAHFNSILGWDGGIYLIAHHEGAKTGRDSELFLLDHDGTVRDRAPLGAVDCHNIGLLEGEQVVCRSKERTVCVSGQVVLRLDSYTRGLALGDDFQIVGTSTEAASREERAQGHGGVVVTDRDFTPLATIVLAGTQVNEIRRVDRPDLGLSSMQRSPAGAAT